jgi:hypothetical protein
MQTQDSVQVDANSQPDSQESRDLAPETPDSGQVDANLQPDSQEPRDSAPETRDSAVDLPSGLVGYWKLDDIASPATDSSGYGQDGTWQYLENGPPVLDADKPAVVRFADPGSLRFVRADGQRVRIPRTTRLEPTGSFTVAAWVKRGSADNTASKWVGMVRKSYQNDSASPYGSYGLQLANTDWSVVCSVTGHVGGIVEDRNCTPANTLPVGVWKHLVAIYDTSQTPIEKRLYVDGVLSHTKKCDVAPLCTAAVQYDTGTGGDLYLGDSGSNSEQFLDGWLDDVRIYSRVLSDTEIAGLALGE